MGHSYFLLLVLWSCQTGAGDGSLELTAFPAMATEGNLYTLVCTSSSNVSQITWYWKNEELLDTSYSNTTCEPVINGNGPFDPYLAGRVSFPTCSDFQHDVALRINSTIDNGTVWRCRDKSTDETSDILTIDIKPTATTSFPQTTPSSTTDAVSGGIKLVRMITDTASTPGVPSLTSTQSVVQTSPEPEKELPIIYIAVAGGVAVVVIIVIVVSIVIIRRRKAHTVKLGEDGNVVKTTEV